MMTCTECGSACDVLAPDPIRGPGRFCEPCLVARQDQLRAESAAWETERERRRTEEERLVAQERREWSGRVVTSGEVAMTATLVVRGKPGRFVLSVEVGFPSSEEERSLLGIAFGDLVGQLEDDEAADLVRLLADRRAAKDEVSRIRGCLQKTPYTP